MLTEPVKRMAKFLFQPDPTDGVGFKPITIDIHLGVTKIVDEEINYDFWFCQLFVGYSVFI
jgi:hypothetical protein